MSPTPASTLHLPPGAWSTVLDCLCDHFAAIPRERWLDRIARGRVLDADGAPITAKTPYRVGVPVHYFREVADEPTIPGEVRVLHADEHLVVVDKPPFLPVTPAGAYVTQTVLARLVAATGNSDLVPLHRLDRLTSGVLLFSSRPDTRDAYQRLFRERRIGKTYEALAPPLPELDFPLVRRSRIERGEPFFRMREVPGEPNSETRIEVIGRDASLWRYRLRPVTGRKHQLRLHMAGLGAPIANDPLYPQLAASAPDDPARPLQLLASALDFVDPLTGEPRHFESSRVLR
ncbi:pseudouridine synthase [Dyella ginsengisoli]|uniref:pseudouridine synthase n=1 Tax=Dyella ginsengisoli TaxID=363848 RepID=UPI00036B4309|nr:pseudouridine synthase [Dyella ginsengisoli]